MDCSRITHLLAEGVECSPQGPCGARRVIASRRVPEDAGSDCVYYLGSWGGEA